MDRNKRKKDLQRVRKRKQRAIAKALQDLEQSSTSESEDELHLTANVPEKGENVADLASVPDEVSDEANINEEIHSEHNNSDQEFGTASGETDNFPSNTTTDEEDLSGNEFSPDENNDLQLRDEELHEDPEIQELRKWAVKHKIYQSHLDELLKILRARLLPSLPKAAKTFLKTVNARYNIVEMEDQDGGVGEFVYFGIENELKTSINPDLHIEKLIELQVNVDPVPITKSGSRQFTPILCKVHFDPDIYDVFPVAIFYGQAKPKNPEIFLDEFVDEVNVLQKDGVIISDVHFDVNLKCLICDTPARAFLKNTLGHGGTYACERCTVQGNRVSNRMVYPSVEAEKRTDESFRDKTQPEHHHPGPSPLLKILPPLNIILCFVLDFMHLVCIGIMKKMLEYWLTGNLNFRLSRKSRLELSRRMEFVKNQVPCEFQRKCRSTHYVGKWKATEFRFFLLYCGPIVLKELLREELYCHFLLLHTSCRILGTEALCMRYTAHAKQYLNSFFIALKDYYGPESQILNAHHLIHLADDVEYMGCSLNRFTAFPFESYLGKLKSFLRSANRPLAQLCRRIHETKSLKEKEKPRLPPRLEILAVKQNEVKRIKFKNVTLANSSPDNMVILEDHRIVRINKLYGDVTNLMFKGQIWKKKQPIFTYPSNFRHLGMWQLENEISRRSVTCPVTDIANKLVKLSVSLRENASEKVYVIPFIH